LGPSRGRQVTIAFGEHRRLATVPDRSRVPSGGGSPAGVDDRWVLLKAGAYGGGASVVEVHRAVHLGHSHSDHSSRVCVGHAISATTTPGSR